MSGQAQREAIRDLQSKGLSERAACRLSGVKRRIAQYQAKQPDQDAALEDKIRKAVQAHPEFGYRQVAGFIHESEDRVRRLWERLRLKCQKPRKSRRKLEPNPKEPSTQPR